MSTRRLHPMRGLPGTAETARLRSHHRSGYPVMYEDEGQEEMGDSEVHTGTLAILDMGLRAHLADRPEYRVFTN